MLENKIALRLSPCLTISQDIVCLGTPLKMEMRNLCTLIASLPGITEVGSWMWKYPPKGGLVFCILCVVTWTNPDLLASPPVGTKLWDVKNKVLTTVSIQKCHCKQNLTSSQRPYSLPCFQDTMSTSQILDIPVASQQIQCSVNTRILTECSTLPLHWSWKHSGLE